MISDNTNPDADLDAAYSAMNGGVAAQIRNNIANTAGTNADQEAGYQHLARFTQQPLPTVRNNPDEIKQQAAVQSLDAENIASQSPHTANLLADPNKAAIAHDDIDNLTANESAVKQLGLFNSVKRIGVAGLNAVKDVFDTQNNPLGFDPETYEALGLNNKQPGVGGFLKQLPANLLSGGAGLVDLAGRAVSAPFSAAIEAATQSAREMGMGESGANRLNRDLSGMLENEMYRSLAGHTPDGEPEEVAQARDYLKQHKAQEATTTAEELTRINDLATASKVRERDTSSFQDFIKSAAQDAPVKDLYVDANTFAQAAGDKLLPLLEQMPELREKLANATQTGGDVRIPVEDFAAHIAGTDLAPQLIPHLKTEPDGFSQTEADNFMQTQGDSLKAEVEKTLAEKQGDDAFTKSKQAVQDQYEDRLNSVNRFSAPVNKQYASLLSNFYATQAARMGVLPEEFARDYPLNITSQDLAEGFGQGTGEPFYSALEKNIEGLQQAKGSPEQWSGIIDNLKNKGVKQEEIDHTGVKDWLAEQKGPVSKEALLEHIRENKVELGEKLKGAPESTYVEGDDESGWYLVNEDNGERVSDPYPTEEQALDASEAGARTQFSKYQLPGGKNYQELLMTLPRDNNNFKSPHFDEPNILAHTRFNDRTGPNGEKILHLEEVQSDWHQKGRDNGYNPPAEEMAKLEARRLEIQEIGMKQGYKNGGVDIDPALKTEWADIMNRIAPDTGKVPDAPFKKTWPELAMKRMIRYAAENGYDKLTWTTGEQQAERYDLSKHVEKVVYRPEQNNLRAYDLSGKKVMDETVQPNKIGDFIGKDAADKLLGTNIDAFGEHNLEGEKLKVGGEGMQGFYDKILPSIANKLGKKYGAQVGETNIRTRGEGELGVSGGANAHPYMMETRMDENMRPHVTVIDRASEERFPQKDHAAAEKFIADRLAEKFPTKVHSLPITPELREGALRGQALFQKDIGKYNPANATISLLNGANLSTFLHESGHFFLDTLTKIASIDAAPQDIKDDAAKVMKNFGVKDLDTWHGMSLDEQRPFHERFARGFESFLMDGKAPSMELQPVFQRMRSWLLNVYRSAKDFLTQNPEAGHMDDEVRGVMERMLATSHDIKTAEIARGTIPLFKTAEEAGMKPEEFADYREKDLSARQDAVTELDTRRMRDMQWLDNAKNETIKQLQREANAKRASIRDMVSMEVQKEPVYSAERYIRRGVNPENPNEKALGSTKLSIDGLRQIGADQDTIDRLGFGKYGMAAKDGVHPDALAEMFGYSSGKELVHDLLNAEPMREKVAGLTDQRMLERHGDLTDPASIARAADKAIHNDARTRILTTELKALNKQLGNKPLLVQAAKQFANGMIDKENASKLNPNIYMSNAARAGRAAEEAFRSGNLQEAALQKRNQLINQYAVKAAFEAQKAVQSVLTQAKKLENNSYREKIPGNYLEQIDSLLQKYDLRKAPTGDPSRAEVNLSKWVEAQRAAGFEPAVADWLALDPRKIGYKDMSVEEVKGLGDAVKSMLHMAREVKKVTIAGEQLALDNVVNEMLKPLQERGENFSKEELINRPQAGVDSFLKVAMDKMASTLRLSVSDLKNFDVKWNAYDLHELQGPFGKYLFEPMFERNYWKQDKLRENSEFFKSWGEKLGKDWQKSLYNLVPNKTLIDPDLSTPGNNVFMKVTRAKLLAMMAHVGNESNFDKLTRGYNWQGADVMNFIHENATKQDWDAVQAQGKIFEKYWPEIEGMSRRLGGVPPSKIELRPIETKFGKYDGWYAPIDYDPIRSKLSAKYGDVMADPHEQIGQEQNYRATTTFNGSMQNRQAGYTDRVNLDFHGFESRLRDTVHDLAYREQLIDANKIINNSKFKQQFMETFGREEYKGLGSWLRGIRDMNASESQIKGFEKFMQYSRQGVVMTGIAYRVSTVLKHGSSAALKSLGYLGDGTGAKYFAARAARMATGNAQEDIAGARDKFPEIRSRLMQMDRDYKEGSASMYKPEDWRAKNDRFGHAMVAWSDALTAVPTAWAAYDRAIAEGVPESMGGTGKPMTEKQAVAYANKTVREAHGTALEVNRSLFMQARGVKGLFGTIYGFMNNTFGQMGDMFDKMVSDGHFKDKPAVAARAMATIVAPALMASWIAGTNKDDPWYEWGAKAIAGEVAGTVPMVRDAWNMFEYGMQNADTVGPLRVIQDVVNSARDVYHEAEGKSSHAAQDIANAFGEIFHVGGLGQAGKSLQYLRDVHTGKQNPKNAMDIVKGVTVGPPPKS